MNIKQFIQRENNNLDLVRIICASMVIIGHSYELTDPAGQKDIIRLLVGFTYSGTLAVQIFFFISGLLVTNSLLNKQSLINFSFSRFFRLVPGLLFVLLITTFIIGPLVSTFTASAYFSDSSTYKYLIDNALYRDNYALPGVFTDNRAYGVNGSLWSLSYEVGCYLFLLGVFCLIRTNKLLSNLLIIFIIADTLFKFNLLFGWLDTRNRIDTGLFRMSFALGALLAVNAENIKLDWRIPVGLAVMAFVFWQSTMMEALFVATCCFAFVFFSSTQLAKSVKIKYDISYGIYLWGFLVQQTLYHCLGPVNVYLFMAYSLYITSVMGFVSFLLIERPCMRYGKALEASLRRRFAGRQATEQLSASAA